MCLEIILTIFEQLNMKWKSYGQQNRTIDKNNIIGLSTYKNTTYSILHNNYFSLTFYTFRKNT